MADILTATEVSFERSAESRVSRTTVNSHIKLSYMPLPHSARLLVFPILSPAVQLELHPPTTPVQFQHLIRRVPSCRCIARLRKGRRQADVDRGLSIRLLYIHFCVPEAPASVYFLRGPQREQRLCQPRPQLHRTLSSIEECRHWYTRAIAAPHV